MIRTRHSLNLYIFISKCFHLLFDASKIKLHFEYLYWWISFKKEGVLGNEFYRKFYLDYFQLDMSFYSGKKILDIGCGPRGSLEWTEGADCYGLDPLVSKYKKLGIDKHRMTYVEGCCESIPFEDEYFDIISSFNSLDHVDDLNQSIKEIKRVLCSGGYFLLITDVHKDPTLCEPSGFDWDIVDAFQPVFTLLEHKEYEGDKLYASIRAGIPFDHTDSTKRFGVLTALFKKI